MTFKPGYILITNSDSKALPDVFPSLESLGRYIARQDDYLDKFVPLEIRHVGLYFEGPEYGCAQPECEA